MTFDKKNVSLKSTELLSNYFNNPFDGEQSSSLHELSLNIVIKGCNTQDLQRMDSIEFFFFFLSIS